MRPVTSPMAGTVSRIVVRPGEAVLAGQEVIVLESMKMEIAVQAEIAGTVKAVKVREGEFVDEGGVLLELD